jgi:tRNA (cmo5U34)-methyltransferase
MQVDKSNTWLEEKETSQVELYVNSASVILPERDTTIKILLDILSYHFDERTGLSILDLGGGDGIITAAIQNRYPDNSFYLLDGSPVMLEKARQRLGQERCVFIPKTFEAYLDADVEDAKYDFVFSVNAIHHLDFLDKAKLYAKLFRELGHGGLFIDIDPVLPTSERSERWQFNMWRDWVNETLVQKGFQTDVGKYDDLPQVYKQKPENKPSGLFEQMQLLTRIGFRDVDCFFKHGIFAVFGGTK